MDELQPVPHSAIGELATQVYDLTRLAFGSYPGVLAPSAAHRAWYVRRPGMDATLSPAIVHGRRLVASAFVTVARMLLGGRLRPVGIVDTVMTHPDYRRQGLARRVLAAAVAGMRARGLAASLLYTVPDSIAYRFYRSLGYRAHAPVHYFRHERAAGGPSVPVAERLLPADEGAVAAFLNAHFAGHDGFVPIDGELWRWRRSQRPPELPAAVYLVRDGHGIRGCVTLCRAPIVASTAPASYVLADLAVAAGAHAPETLASLLAPLPAGAEALALSAAGNEAENRLLAAAGFGPQGSEVAMVLPLTSEAERDLAAPPPPWYVLTESVIGV